MLQKPMDVLEHFPVRKSRKQKQAFLRETQEYLSGLGYSPVVEKGSFGARNLVIGDPEKAKYLITAHYDTCAWLPFPNFITPCSFLPFLIYQVLLLVLIFGVAMGVGVAVRLLTDVPEFSGTAAYIAICLMTLLMLVGPANRHNANDNTSGVVTVLDIARHMPQNLREKVCFVLFDLEEAGLIGSASYRSKHKKASEKQLILNLDCVGEGDTLLFFPTAKLKKEPEKLSWLANHCGNYGKKNLKLHKKGFGYYPSDQANFPGGVGICALCHNRLLGYYLGKIHTGRDRVLDETNVNILRACLISMVGSDAAE